MVSPSTWQIWEACWPTPNSPEFISELVLYRLRAEDRTSWGESARRLSVYHVNPASRKQFLSLSECAVGWHSPACGLDNMLLLVGKMLLSVDLSQDIHTALKDTRAGRA